MRSYTLYADEGLVAESQQAINVQQAQDGAEPTITASAAPQIISQYGIKPDSPNSTGVLFIKTKNTKEQDTIAYYHHDHLGTPIQATDRSGIIVWSAQYAAFGQATLTTPQAPEDKPVIESNLRFPGQLEDAETGLYYNWHRYYDPETGRYVTADPIGLVGGVNLYVYVAGDPVNWYDQFGLEICAPNGQSKTCTDGQRPPPEGSPMNGPLSPSGVAKTVGEAAAALCPPLRGAKAGTIVDDLVRAGKNGETTATKIGRRAHREEPLPPGFERDLPIPGTRKRMDGYNRERKEIIEIKPNNKRKINEGEKQAQDYCESCNNSDLGTGHTARPVQTYDPGKYK